MVYSEFITNAFQSPDYYAGEYVNRPFNFATIIIPVLCFKTLPVLTLNYVPNNCGTKLFCTVFNFVNYASMNYSY